jgi:hypothetical protein
MRLNELVADAAGGSGVIPHFQEHLLHIREP